MAATAESGTGLRDSKSEEAELDSSFAELTNSLPSRGLVSLTYLEKNILSLHDQLGDLCLEYALLEAQQKLAQDSTSELSSQEAESQLRDAERECLEARAAYLLKNSVVDDVLSVDPLLKAIHAGTGRYMMERNLHALVDQRDILSMAHANLSATLQGVLNTTTATAQENVIAMRQNQELTTTLLGLTSQLQTQDVESIENAELRSQLKTMQEETKESKRRWRIMKSLTAAVVAGSGIDWARNDDLRELVLDDEE
ncbi:hypothetical protein MMC30_007465 [Trapelia coarctata]|nr:hypothetical protein [Trapelia coarctata]